MSQKSSNTRNNQISISFQTLDLESVNLEVPYKSVGIKFSDNYQDGKVKADELNMEYLTIPDYRKNFSAFPSNKRQDLEVFHNSISIDRKKDQNLGMDIFNDHFFEGAKNNWDCTYGSQKYGFREITTESNLDLDWLKFETRRDLNDKFKSTIIDFNKLVDKPSLLNEELYLNAVRFKGGIPQEVAFEHDFIDYFASYFSRIFTNYLNESTYKDIYEKVKSIDSDDLNNSLPSDLDSYTPDYQEDTMPDFPTDDSQLDEINYNFGIEDALESASEESVLEEFEHLDESEFEVFLLTELSELFELNNYEGDLLFNFEYRFDDVLDLPYANKFNIDKIKSSEKEERNEFVESIYQDLVLFIGGLGTLERKPYEDVIIAIEQVFRSLLMNSYIPETYFESLAKNVEFASDLEEKVKESLLTIQKIDRKYINSDYKKLAPTYVSNFDINEFGEMGPIEEVNAQLEEFRNILNGVKYLGPLRSLENLEKKQYSFPQQTPIGIFRRIVF